jgi:hypothetical protein
MRLVSTLSVPLMVSCGPKMLVVAGGRRTATC